MNKMQRLCIAFIDVNSVKFAYSVGIEERIYICFAKNIYVAKCKWKRFNKSDRYPIRENAWSDRCKQALVVTDSFETY